MEEGVALQGTPTAALTTTPPTIFPRWTGSCSDTGPSPLSRFPGPLRPVLHPPSTTTLREGVEGREKIAEGIIAVIIIIKGEKHHGLLIIR